MTRGQRWAGYLTITTLTALVGTVAGLLWFAPRDDFTLEQIPAPPPVAATPARAVATFPGCVESARWPKGTPADWVVVAWPDGRVERMRFADAWARGTSPTHDDDVWVIGVCR